MSRRTISKKRVPLADPKYNSRTIGRFINRMMHAGKKTVAEKVIYRALEMVAERTKKNPTEIFEQAIKNAGPMIEVRPRRVGGSTLQVPVDVPSDRRQALAVRWILASVRARSGKDFSEKLAGELIDCAAGQGSTIKKKEEVHKMAEANRAFAHYRW
ncbi:MAG TPA: 30S ribosomal protein S7 [Anaerolineae bacterium]|jgi:small subunit ribosomal protein S7